MPHSKRLCITHCGNLRLCPARRRVLHALLRLYMYILSPVRHW